MVSNLYNAKAYSYIRMSTDIQLKGNSLQRQLELSKNYADINNLELVDTIKDIGVSAFKGKNLKEGALKTFSDALESGHIEKGSYLLIESLDRLSRDSVVTAFNEFTKILQFGIVIVTLTDNQKYTLESLQTNIGQLFTSLGIMLRANEESQVKSLRLKAAWKNKRNSIKTKKITSLSPAWLKYDEISDSFLVVEEFSETIKTIFKMSINGFGAYSICKFLNANLSKYKSINNKNGWHKSYVQKILNNPAVYGEFHPHVLVDGNRIKSDLVVENYFPSIIDKETFNLSRARIQQRKLDGAGRKGSVFSNLFTRIIKCGKCDASICFLNKGEGKKGGKYLICSNSHRGFNCDAPSWEYDIFEKSFFEFIFEIDLNSIFTNDEISQKKKAFLRQIEISKISSETLDAEYKNLLNQLSKLSADVQSDLFNLIENKKSEIKIHDENIKKLGIELNSLDRQSESTKNIKEVEYYLNDLKTKTPDEQKIIRQKIHNYIKQIVKSIVIRNYESFHAGDKIEDFVDEKFIKLLEKKGYKDRKVQEDYLLTETGNKVFSEYTRSFIVTFKNNTKRIVYDQSGLNLKISNKFL
jgi:DNA invertase Pin-like site-specific DNA recombinase